MMTKKKQKPEMISSTTRTNNNYITTTTTSSATTTTTFCTITKYKWATNLVKITHSAIELLVTLFLSFLLQAWHWTLTVWDNSQDLSFSVLANFFTSIWNNISTTMTIEVISAETDSINMENIPRELQGGRPVIPTLRLNSKIIEDLYTNDGNTNVQSERDDKVEESDQGSGSSNYNTSDGEHDSGLVYTDPEENESNDGTNSPSPTPGDPIPPEPINNLRRDSDSSDISSDGLEQEKNEKDSGVIGTKLLAQVESMFSDDHLAKDGFLLKHVRRRSDGFVSLKLVAGLRKVKQISRDFDVILSSLRKSDKLEVNTEGTKVRRIEPLTAELKSLPVAGNKDKENNANTKNASSDSVQNEFVSRVNQKGIQGQQKKPYRRDSNYSTCSSNGSSRNGSFSMPYHPGNDFYRNMMVYVPGDEVPPHIRRRGGSLPMPVMCPAEHQAYLNFPYQQYQAHYGPQGQRNSMYLVPTNSSPPTGTGIQTRPKSNSYCEGAARKNSTGGMSLWLQRRLANSRTSEGSLVVSGVIRQPRGPDGTKGFATGYRELILKEREALSQAQL